MLELIKQTTKGNMKLSKISAITAISFGLANAEWIFDPVKCNNIPVHLSTICKDEIRMKGEFELSKLKNISDCKRIYDTSQINVCISQFANGENYYVTGREAAMIGIKIESKPLKSSEERIASATEEIAFFTKIQTITNISILAIGTITVLLLAIK